MTRYRTIVADPPWEYADGTGASYSTKGRRDCDLQVAAPARIHSRWFDWSRSAHSAKPEAFLDLVEQVSPGPYLELFARRQRLGWDTWGNEALNHVDLAEGAA